VIGFLKVLLRKISGTILIVWDGSPLHRRFKPFSALARQNGSILSDLLDRLLISIPLRAFGNTSSVVSWETSVVPILTSFLLNSSVRESVCDTHDTSSKPVLFNAVMRFRFLQRGQ